MAFSILNMLDQIVEGMLGQIIHNNSESQKTVENKDNYKEEIGELEMMKPNKIGILDTLPEVLDDTDEKPYPVQIKHLKKNKKE